ncbi:ThiF family adenylyltransferase [Micromonospora tulbaghiae]|uniref:HesA/MoeB/ThiF family protein n=1 Tax=Micromonospora tulbaghiae TaxID=479978 RepID=UPI0033E8D010
MKPEHGPFRVNDKKIHIGGTSFGIAAEIEDPTGSVWTLLESLDGECNVEQVIDKVLCAHPAESRTAALRAIETLFQSGYIEDVAAPDPDELTERDKERYARSRAYFRWADLTPRLSTWEPQALLRRASVTVVGVGGTGGNAALALAMSGVGHVHCVDCDDVELSNLNRQALFTEADVGRPKWVAAVERLRQHNSDIVVTGEHCEVAGVEDVKKLSRDCDVLVLCADQPSDIRAWTNRGCLATGTSWVEAGYHGPQISFSVFTPGEGGCWECLRLTSQERYTAMGANFEDTYALRAKAVANAVAAPTAGLGGYLAAHGAISLITGVGRPPAGRIYSALNLVALDHKFVLDYPRREDCPACGSS